MWGARGSGLTLVRVTLLGLWSELTRFKHSYYSPEEFRIFGVCDLDSLLGRDEHLRVEILSGLEQVAEAVQFRPGGIGRGDHGPEVLPLVVCETLAERSEEHTSELQSLRHLV